MRKPIFCAVMNDGNDGWSVEAEWPDGTIEQVSTFKAHSDAANWITNQSQAWLDSRAG